MWHVKFYVRRNDRNSILYVTQEISVYLTKARGLGIRNILALRGDLPNIDEEWQVERMFGK